MVILNIKLFNNIIRILINFFYIQFTIHLISSYSFYNFSIYNLLTLNNKRLFVSIIKILFHLLYLNLLNLL